MFQLKDKYGYAINPKNVCYIEECKPDGSFHTDPYLFVVGKDSKSPYEYEEYFTMQEDLRALMDIFDNKGIKLEGSDNFGSYYINTENLFSMGPAEGVPLKYTSQEVLGILSV